MTLAEPGSVSAVLPARRAREVLSSALGFVQLVESTSPLLTSTIAELAGASNALYRVESEALTDEAGVSLVCSAIDQLTRALVHLQEAKLHDRALEVPAQATARALAMLYPLSQTASRRRREVMPQGALSQSEIAELRGAVSTGARPGSGPFDGRERRRQPEARSVFEVEIGLSSESNFYAGLTSDVSMGGLFVSTHQPAAAGVVVTLYFVLPDGHSVEATGIVRWTREASADASPGMGVAFTRLKPEDSAAIARYCGHRAPLFHEND
jgi:uncharacterized protein (TIGR02266 family)